MTPPPPTRLLAIYLTTTWPPSSLRESSRSFFKSCGNMSSPAQHLETGERLRLRGVDVALGGNEIEL